MSFRYRVTVGVQAFLVPQVARGSSTYTAAPRACKVRFLHFPNILVTMAIWLDFFARLCEEFLVPRASSGETNPVPLNAVKDSGTRYEVPSTPEEPTTGKDTRTTGKIKVRWSTGERQRK